MSKIENVVIHISASPFGCAPIIRKWHVEGNGWADIGYNYIIGNGYASDSNFYNPVFDGAVEQGRVVDGDLYLAVGEVGAHALGYNRDSLGICLIGRRKDGDKIAKFTEKQMHSLIALCIFIHEHYGVSFDNFFGHYETPQSHGKTCPDMDMPSFREILKYEYERHNDGTYRYY